MRKIVKYCGNGMRRSIRVVDVVGVDVMTNRMRMCWRVRETVGMVRQEQIER